MPISRSGKSSHSRRPPASVGPLWPASPPSASELLLRLGRAGKISDVDPFLKEWELWAAELLESHLSFPVLSYYRSQHDNQSWLAALTTMLDTSALLLAVVDLQDSYQSQLTFAMARHAAVDLALVLKVSPVVVENDRLPMEKYEQLHARMEQSHIVLSKRDDAATKFAELRGMYEPFLIALSQRFLLTLPPVFLEHPTADNWQRSAWMQRTPGIGNLVAVRQDDDHFA